MTRLTPVELAAIEHPVTHTNWIATDTRQQLFAHIAALEAELALTRNALVDLLQESHAYAAGRVDTAAWVRRWWEDDSRPGRELSEWLDAQPSPPPDAALLARLVEALEALRPLAEQAKYYRSDDRDDLDVLLGPDGANTLILGHFRRAAEILQRNEKAPVTAPPGPTQM